MYTALAAPLFFLYDIPMSDTEEISLKETLRQEARRHRARTDVNLEEADEAAKHFATAIKPKKHDIIAAYWPKGREFDPRPILEQLLKKGFACALPVVKEKSLILGFARWDEEVELVRSKMGVFEPEINIATEWVDPDIVIVPLLAFDRRGYRLGNGGGYYDATLAALRKKKPITAVGVAYGHQACLFNLPVEPHDQKLDWVITPAGTHYFD
jgi:5-formyltetrahydrofolate cyclo-ligase